MVKSKKIFSHLCDESEIVFKGQDACCAYSLLKRIYERTKESNFETFTDIKVGTLIFKDELAVLDKLFQ